MLLILHGTLTSDLQSQPHGDNLDKFCKKFPEHKRCIDVMPIKDWFPIFLLGGVIFGIYKSKNKNK